MDAIRGFCFYVVLGVTVIFLSLAALLAAPFTNEVWRYEKLCRPWAKFILRTLEVICGVHVKVEGWENMPPAESAHVVLAKHQSAWDPFWLGAWLPARASFLYKKSLHWIPVVGWLIWSMNMLAIDRSQGRSAFQNFMAKGPEYLRRGWWITLFPEGTRVPPGERVRYKTGGARFACSTGTPILPIAHNAGLFWPKNSIAKKAGTITVEVGPIIETAGREPHEVTLEVEAWIERTTARLIDEAAGRSAS